MAKRVMLVDDHQLVREALRRALEDAGYRVIEAEDGSSAVERALTTDPHVVLMDVSMPVMDGIQATRAMRTRVPEALVVVLTMHEEDELILRAREAGAVGYLLKTAASSEVVDAVARVLDGHQVFPPLSGAGPANSPTPEAPSSAQSLSHREQQILQLLADGRSPDAVADALVISPKTVRNHLSRVYDKLGVDNRTQAILVAIQRGLIELS